MWTTYVREALSRAEVRWQNCSDWLVTCLSWNCASTAASQVIGACDQKARRCWRIRMVVAGCATVAPDPWSGNSRCHRNRPGKGLN